MLRKPAPETKLPAVSGGQLLRCGISLGSNVGDRFAHFSIAAQALAGLADFTTPVLKAPIYETAPVDCAPGTAPFANSVIDLTFYGTPQGLLSRLRAIERHLGRPDQREKNSPRTLDLDLLYAGDVILQSTELTVPHPRMTQRLFVMEPLHAIRPELVLPDGLESVSEITRRLRESALEPPPVMIREVW